MHNLVTPIKPYNYFTFLYLTGILLFLPMLVTSATTIEIMYNPLGVDARNEWVSIKEIDCLMIQEELRLVESGVAHHLTPISSNNSELLTKEACNIIMCDNCSTIMDQEKYPTLQETYMVYTATFSLSNSGEYVALRNTVQIIVETNYSAIAREGYSVRYTETSGWIEGDKGGLLAQYDTALINGNVSTNSTLNTTYMNDTISTFNTSNTSNTTYTTNTSTNVNTTYTTNNTYNTTDTNDAAINTTLCMQELNLSNTTTASNVTAAYNETGFINNSQINQSYQDNQTNTPTTTITHTATNITGVTPSTLTCSGDLQIILKDNKTQYLEGETSEFKIIIANMTLTNYTISYWVEDIFGRIIKPVVETKNQQMKSFTPKLEENSVVFIIRALLIAPNCTPQMHASSPLLLSRRLTYQNPVTIEEKAPTTTARKSISSTQVMPQHNALEKNNANISNQTINQTRVDAMKYTNTTMLYTQQPEVPESYIALRYSQAYSNESKVELVVEAYRANTRKYAIRIEAVNENNDSLSTPVTFHLEKYEPTLINTTLNISCKGVHAFIRISGMDKEIIHPLPLCHTNTALKEESIHELEHVRAAALTQTPQETIVKTQTVMQGTGNTIYQSVILKNRTRSTIIIISILCVLSGAGIITVIRLYLRRKKALPARN